MEEKSAMNASGPPPAQEHPSQMHHAPIMHMPMPMPTYPNQAMPPGPYDPQAQQYQHQQQGYHPQPPPPYFDQPPQQHHPHVIMQQPVMQQTILVAPRVGPDPCALVCPSCHKQIVTRMDYETSTKTHVVAAICCLFVCWPCAWLPYVMDSCKNANHYCPHCNAFIGTYDGF